MVYRVWYRDEGLGQYCPQSRGAFFACDFVIFVDDRRKQMNPKEEMRGGITSLQMTDAGLHSRDFGAS